MPAGDEQAPPMQGMNPNQEELPEPFPAGSDPKRTGLLSSHGQEVQIPGGSNRTSHSHRALGRDQRDALTGATLAEIGGEEHQNRVERPKKYNSGTRGILRAVKEGGVRLDISM